MLNTSVTRNLQSGEYHAFVSHWRNSDGTKPTFVSPGETDITSLSPTSLLSFQQGFHRANFLPKPTQDELFYASQVKKDLPTWAFNVGAGTTGDIADLTLHYKSPNFFFKTNFSTNQINVSSGLELWRGASIANGIIHWKVSPDVLAYTSSESFWQSLYDIQHWVSIIKLANPGARFIDLYDQNGKVIHRIDLIQSPPGRPAFLKELPDTSGFYDPDGYHAAEAKKAFKSGKNGKNGKNRTRTSSQPKINPHSSHITIGQDLDNDVDNDDDYEFYYYDEEEEGDEGQEEVFLHQPMLPQEAVRQSQLHKEPIISLFQPLLNYIRDSISRIDLNQYSDEQLNAYLNEIHTLSTTLPRSMQQEVKNSPIYSQLYDLVQQLPVPEFATQDQVYINQLQHTKKFEQEQLQLIIQENTQQQEQLTTNNIPPPTYNIINSTPHSPTHLHDDVITDSNHIQQIINNGDPFDMSNISDRQMLSLPRTDTPYTFQPDPYYFSSHVVLLNAAKILQLPALFKYINVYANFHYSFVPDPALIPYKPDSITEKIEKRRTNQLKQQQNNSNAFTQPEFLNGEHHTALSCHIQSHNDRFHALFVSNSLDNIYSGRIAFSLLDENAHCDSFTDDHPLSPNYKPWVKHPAQKLLLPDVFFTDESESKYLRKPYLQSTQHIFGLQGIVYPSNLPHGYNPLVSTTKKDKKGEVVKPTFDEFASQISTPPLSVLGRFNASFDQWYRRNNIAMGLEFQYAYVRPIKFDFWDSIEGIATGADACLDCFDFNSSFPLNYLNINPDINAMNSNGVMNMKLVEPLGGGIVLSSQTDTTTLISQDHTQALIPQDPILPLPPSLDLPFTPIPSFNHKLEADNQGNRKPSRFFRDGLISLRGNATEQLTTLRSYLPTFLSKRSDDITIPASIVSSADAEISVAAAVAPDGVVDNTVVTKDITPTSPEPPSTILVPSSFTVTPTPTTPSPQSQQSPPQPHLEEPNQSSILSTANPHTFSLTSLFKLRQPISYQPCMVSGVNINTNGTVQGYSTVDITPNTSISMAVVTDLARPPVGAIRPLGIASKQFSIGFEVSYNSR